MFPTLAAYLHTIDPFAIKLWTGTWMPGLRWYGLSYLAGFVVAYLLIRRIARQRRTEIAPQDVGDMIFALALGVLIGARLGYAVFYSPSLLWEFSGSFPYWGLPALNRGGMSSHGGMIGVVLAGIWFARRSRRKLKQPLGALPILDLIAFTAPIGLFFGRIANFINGELFGRACGKDLPWAVKFPQEMYDWGATKTLQLQQQLPPPNPAVAADLTVYVNWLIERIQRGQQEVIEIVEPLLTARHPSQLYAALLEGLTVFIVLVIIWARPRKPGVISGWFCTAYGVVRIIDEFFRQPDSQITHQEFDHFGFTRGQGLSAILLLAGIAMIVICRRRQGKLLGGWSTRAIR